MSNVVEMRARQEQLADEDSLVEQEIAGRKLAEEALRASERLLRIIAANYPAYLSIIERDLTVGFTSGREFAKRNLVPDEFVGLTLEQVFGEHASLVREHYLRAFAGEAVRFELVFEGQVQLYDVVPLYEENGEIQRILAVVEDITDRRRAEEGQRQAVQALRESEERYRTVVEHSPAGIVIIDDAYRILYANEREAQILGRPLEAIVGHDFQTFLDEETRWFVADRYVRRQRGEDVPSAYEFDVVHPNGEKRRVETTVTLFRDSSGAVRSVAQMLDVTEHRLNEMRLNSLLELSQMAHELSEPEIVQAAIEQAVSLTGSEIGYSHFVNPDQQSIRLVTWSETTMEQCTAAYETHYPLDQAGVWADCVRLGKPVVHNDYQSLPDKKGYPLGHVHLVRHVSVPVFDAGRVVLILGVGNKPGDYDETDVRQMLLIGDQLLKILERRRADEELLKLSRAIEQSPSTVVITDTHGNIEYVNPKFTEVSGYSPEEVIGQNPRIFQSGDQPAQFFADLWDTILAGGEWQGEFSNRKKSGKVYWELASISPIRNAAGEVTHYLKVAEDITARKQVEESLRERTAELQARNEDLDAFAHTVAHDLKNPLSLIIGFADLLEDTCHTLDDKALVGYVRNIARHSRKMDNIISELLLLAAARQADVDTSVLDMSRIVREARQRLAGMIESAGAEILEPSVWPAAWGYGPWIEEVWVNYISNALKYGGDPPRVELGADVPDSGPLLVRFWVRDNGPGLSQAEKEKLFAPFTRLAHVRAEGHGLGLSIVRRIVEKLGGQVGVESEVGKGSVFYFTLLSPIVEE
jgi:PAS domain S-box-containing protein